MAIIDVCQGMDVNSSDLKVEKANVSIKVQDLEWLVCDGCGAQYIESESGYVCPECGLTPQEDYQILKYYKPYDDGTLQNAPLGSTQIGTVRERLSNTHSAKLEKLSRLQSIKRNEEVVIEKAKIEISRIFESLNLSSSLKDIVFNRFKKIRRELRPGTKFRSPEKLIPICIYYTLKFQNVSINEKELLEVSKISKKEFNTFKLMLSDFLPGYKMRKRKDYILQKISEIGNTFDLNMEFYFQSKKTLYKLWEIIKNTKDDVIAGLVSSITVLSSFPEKASVNSICKRLGIKMSTIQSQVKKNIIDRFHVSGFVSLVKSAGILKVIMEKLGIIESENEIIEVEFGNATEIYNHFDNTDFYFHVLKMINGDPLFIKTIVYSKNFGNGGMNRQSDTIVDIHSEWFSQATGPP